MRKKHPIYQAPAAILVSVCSRLALQASFTTPIESLTPVEYYEDEDFWS